MRIGDDELWNLVNGAILRFRRPYTRQNPMARYLIQHLLENIIENNAIEVTQWEVQFGAEIPVKNFVNILLRFLNGSRVAFNSPHFATCSLPYAGSDASRSTTYVKHLPAKRRHVLEHFRARAFKILFGFRSLIPSQAVF